MCLYRYPPLIQGFVILTGDKDFLKYERESKGVHDDFILKKNNSFLNLDYKASQLANGNLNIAYASYKRLCCVSVF